MLSALDASTLQIWFTVAIIIVAVVMFAIDRIPLEIPTIGAVCALMVFFHLVPFQGADGANLLSPEALLQGFANPVLFTIISLLIIGQGLFQTGAINGPARIVARLGQRGALSSFAITIATAGLVSGFLNNTPVVVIFVPIMAALAAASSSSIAQYMMPLSFICILGGMTTLIGSSSNLIVATLADDGRMSRIGFFDFSVLGFMLAGIGALYVIFVLPRLLPDRIGVSEGGGPGGHQFVASITLKKDHPWIGLESVAGMFPGLPKITVRMIQRDRELLRRPFDEVMLQEGDVVSVAATRGTLSDVLANPVAPLPVKEKPGDEAGELEDDKQDAMAADGAAPVSPPETPLEPGRKPATLAEAIVPPSSPLIGLNLEQAQMRLTRKLNLVAIKRHKRMLRQPAQNIRLAAGDTVLVLSTPENVGKLRNERSIILLADTITDIPTTHHAATAIAIFACVIVAASTGMVPISIAALTGALATFAFGCINMRQLYRAMDRRIFLLIGAAFALALALQVTGGAEILARGVVTTFAGYGPSVLLSALFLLTAILTNFLSNQATAALMTPVTLSTAVQAGVPPEPFIYGLIFALNCSFATPIAYQTNLIVMGPGNYTFGDFVKGGLPLLLLIWLAYSLIAPVYFGF